VWQGSCVDESGLPLSPHLPYKYYWVPIPDQIPGVGKAALFWGTCRWEGQTVTMGFKLCQ